MGGGEGRGGERRLSGGSPHSSVTLPFNPSQHPIQVRGSWPQDASCRHLGFEPGTLIHPQIELWQLSPVTVITQTGRWGWGAASRVMDALFA